MSVCPCGHRGLLLFSNKDDVFQFHFGSRLLYENALKASRGSKAVYVLFFPDDDELLKKLYLTAVTENPLLLYNVQRVAQCLKKEEKECMRWN